VWVNQSTQSQPVDIKVSTGNRTRMLKFTGMQKWINVYTKMLGLFTVTYVKLVKFVFPV